MSKIVTFNKDGKWFRRCKPCGRVKEIKEYGKNIGRYLNKRAKCKECVRAEATNRYHRNKKFREGKEVAPEVIIRTAWKNMMRRCLNSKDQSYKNYGGRGINIDKEWHIFNNFLKDMLPSYKKGLTLDRIDNSGDYTKENCRWATRQEQLLNRRNNTNLEINGKLFRICFDCKKAKSLEVFPKSTFHYLGRRHRCKECCNRGYRVSLKI